jgi:Tfp pilus assembly protein PilV
MVLCLLLVLAVLAVLAAANSDTESLRAQQGLAEAAVDRSRVRRSALFAAPASARIYTAPRRNALQAPSAAGIGILSCLACRCPCRCRC